MTSLEAELGRPIDRALLLAECLASIGERLGDLRRGRFDAILSAWREWAAPLRGALVEWDGPAGPARGRIEDLDASGALLVRMAGGIERLIAGEVRWI